jgi:phosphate transport system protein
MTTTAGRAHFEQALTRLGEDVLQLGALVEGALIRAMDAVANDDDALAGGVIAGDAAVNDLRTAIEAECYRLLATEQPVARDMRTIVSALTVTSDLERIGDHAKKIASTYRRMAAFPGSVPISELQGLADVATDMLRRAMRAYTVQDVAAAEAICREDDLADSRYRRMFDQTLNAMVENPRDVGMGTYLIQMAHELERTADRATNIAERIIYNSTGKLLDLNV